MKAVPPADDAGRKRRRLDSSASWPLVVPRKDPGDDCVENRPEDGDGTGEGVAGDCPGYGVTSVCCRRREMEDAISVRPDFVRGDHRYHFFGVYVGHGCSHVAESCRNRMHEVVAEEISTSRPGLDRERCAIMERSFALMDAAGRPGDPPPAPTCRCELQTPRCDHVGSTAVVAVVGPDRIVVASCGDSRAVLSHDGAPVPLSTDHKPDRPDELWADRGSGRPGHLLEWRQGSRGPCHVASDRGQPFEAVRDIGTGGDGEKEEGRGRVPAPGERRAVGRAASSGRACGIAQRRREATRPRGPNCGGGSDKGCSVVGSLLTKLALARHSTDNVSMVVIDLRRRL